MYKIYKYPLSILEKQVVKLPLNAKIIRVEDVEGLPFVWAICNTEAELENRYLCLYKTGMTIDRDVDDLEYLGLVRLHIIQELGLYCFEEVSKRGIECDTEPPHQFRCSTPTLFIGEFEGNYKVKFYDTLRPTFRVGFILPAVYRRNDQFYS